MCTSGSVRDEAGQPPHLLGRRDFLHLAAGAAALPAVSQFAWASLPTAYRNGPCPANAPSGLNSVMTAGIVSPVAARATATEGSSTRSRQGRSHRKMKSP